MHSIASGLKARLRGLRYGFLLLPGAIAIGLVGLAFGVLALDRATGAATDFAVANDPDAARTVLSVIAGSIATVAGVTFSITMVTLQLVSQQFSPRALRGFLGDRVNQAVAGAFIGVFLYCLIVLRTVSAGSSGTPPFVPALAVSVAIVLAVVALTLLLVFIDHMSRMIQVSSIASSVARATLQSLDTIFPAPFGEPHGADPDELTTRWSGEGEPTPVRPERPGYVQSVILDSVPNDVGSDGLRIAMRVAPGDFVNECDVLAEYWPGKDDGDVARALRVAVIVANERDMHQDLGYGVRQLADIATRALSPSINDPTTAVTCIRYLQAVMERLATRAFPERVRHYEDCGVTTITAATDWQEYVDAAFAQVGRYARDARVAGALLAGIVRVIHAAREAGAHDRVPALERSGRKIADTASREASDEEDRERIGALLRLVNEASGGAAVPAR